jgi:glycolate oxidase FAD binding subunit
VVAAGVSGYRRLRYGPTRDRVLEVRAVTGDGRSIKGGGRVVKNVSGYDLPRLYCGSLGSLGVITSVCLKLWPLTAAVATVHLDRVPPPGDLYRPLALLQDPEGVRVLLAGTAEDVSDSARRLGGQSVEGLDLPDPVTGECVWSLRVRPRLLAEAVSRLPPGADFVAQHGVGEVTFGAAADFDITALRAWAESTGGGALVRLRGRSEADPWGRPPPALDLQRRLIAAFDPARVLEPGRLPGRL